MTTPTSHLKTSAGPGVAPPPPTTVADVHPAVRSFMAQNGLTAHDLRRDGRLTLVIDKQYRVHIHPAPNKCMALSAVLLDLAGRYDTRETHATLARLTALAAGLLQQHASSLSLDASRQTLLLQQTLGAETDSAGFEEAIGEFVNALTFWSRACAAEPHG